ncbi:MAG: DUF58 domain-containing protein [Dehalococcoidia bacterium]|nr:DUF58 domain-containing protein [Dehalococcoidia bacterium]
MAATSQAMASEPRDRALELGGHVFGRFTVVALLIVMGVAAWYRQPALVTLLGLTLATVGVSRAWSRLCLRRVRCERTLSTTSLFPGEQLTITTRLSNQKILPLPWLEITQPAPRGLIRSNHVTNTGVQVLTRSLTMPWYSRLTWRETVTPEHRGYYTLSPIALTAGDILGLYPRMMEAGNYEHVSVYPRIYPVRRIPLQRADASGDLTGRLSLQEDPTRMRGIREYQPRDGMRRVHWKASAHHGQLMVKQYEPSALSQVSVALDADSFEGFTDDESYELAVSAVASIACHCVEHQMQVAFFSNARLCSAGGQARLAPGSGDTHLIALLGLLARVTPGAQVESQQLFRELRGVGLSGAGLIVVLGRLKEVHIDTLTYLHKKRCPLLVLKVGDTTPSSGLPFPVRHINGPDELLDLGGA